MVSFNYFELLESPQSGLKIEMRMLVDFGECYSQRQVIFIFVAHDISFVLCDCEFNIFEFGTYWSDKTSLFITAACRQYIICLILK